MRVGDLGFGLVGPGIVPLDPCDPAGWGGLEAICLAPCALESLWCRAVGNGIRSFRGASVERECWEAVLACLSALRQRLRQGTALVLRLDLPSSRCRVRQRPEHPLFPVGSPVQAYELLAALHGDLAHLANHCGQLASGDWLPRGDSPWTEALRAAPGAWRARVAIEGPVPAGATLIATAPGNQAVAWAGRQVACLQSVVEDGTDVWQEEFLIALAAWQGKPRDVGDTNSWQGTIPAGLAALCDNERAMQQRLAAMQVAAGRLTALRGDGQRLWLNLGDQDEPEGNEQLAAACRVLDLRIDPWPGDGYTLLEPTFVRLSAGTGLLRNAWLVPDGLPAVENELQPRALLLCPSALLNAARAALLAEEPEELVKLVHAELAAAGAQYEFHAGACLVTGAERRALLG